MNRFEMGVGVGNFVMNDVEQVAWNDVCSSHGEWTWASVWVGMAAGLRESVQGRVRNIIAENVGDEPI